MKHDEETQIELEHLVFKALALIGEDPARPGLLDTPKRVAKMWLNELSTGLHDDPESLVNSAVFEEGTEGMVVVRDIPFYSVCEHHLVPFHGVAHIAYIPTRGRVVGLSKLARVLESISRKPQVQERITHTVADVLFNSQLYPEGVGVVISAEHLCMSMRGVQKAGSKTVTSAVRGSFREEAETRSEFFSLLQVNSVG